MTSKKFKWQARWTLAGPLATHDTGVTANLVQGAAVITDPAQALAILTPKNGAHNAPIMLARLTREAQALVDGPRDGNTRPTL
jgi:hypothetical protein